MQLALSPSARSPGEPITVSLDTQFVLKVEGVIDHGQRPGLDKLHNYEEFFGIKWEVEFERVKL